ncbi:MAG: flippase-like domain-containing protein [Eubacterium sp.]|nr:flippase-like domain-containing protein [Eubacterium sp.]
MSQNINEAQQQPAKISRKSVIIGVVILVAAIALTFYTIIKNLSGHDIIATLKQVSPLVIVIGLVMMLLFSFFEGLNMYRVLKLAGYPVTLWTTWKYAIVGFFYSGITPSSSGGQPMQIYYMYQDNIRLSHALGAVIMQLFGHEAANALFGLVGFIALNHMIVGTIGHLKYLVCFGILINVAYFFFLALCLFSQKAITLIKTFLTWFIGLFDRKKSGKLQKKIGNILDEYSSLHDLIKQDRTIAIKTIITAILQFICLYSIPAIVYFGFGYTDFNFFEIELLQGVIFISVGFIPIPGSAGVSEGMTLMLFRLLYPAATLGGAVLLGRCLSMYFTLILYCIILFVFISIFKVLKNRRNN